MHPIQATERGKSKMKATPSALVLTGIMALFSGSAFSASVPHEIFQPHGAKIIKAQRRDGNKEFEAEFQLKGSDVGSLASKIRNHAQRHGFKIIESDITPRDAGLKFKRHNQELEVSIEQKDGIIEYKADLAWHN